MRYLVSLFFLLLTISSTAQEDRNLEDFHSEGIVSSFFSLIINERFEQLTIKSDFDLLRAKRMQKHDQKAVLEFKNPLGEVQSWEVTLEVRGNFRRKICKDMPPLKLIFPKETLEKKGFPDNYRKYKLVTHCLNTEKSEQKVAKEFWTYKLYNELTPNSFRVHPLQITYLNTADGTSSKHLGFMIEDNDELEDRINGKMKDTWGLSPEQVNANSYRDVILFQYMIGNADWGIAEYRNIKFIFPENDKKPIIVPYDFDCSGLVAADYAVPNVNVGQSYIGQRIVMGKLSTQQLNRGIQQFNYLTNKEWSFYLSDYLSETSKEEMNAYLASFIKTVSNQKRIERLFLE